MSNLHHQTSWLIHTSGFFSSRPNPQVTARLLSGRKVLGVTSTNGKRGNHPVWFTHAVRKSLFFPTPLDSHLWCASAICMAMARCTRHPTIRHLPLLGEFGQVLPVFNILNNLNEEVSIQMTFFSFKQESTGIILLAYKY